MALALGLVACIALWWISKRGRLGAARLSLAKQSLAGWAALAVAGALLLHGNLIVAAVLGLAGLWSLEGPEGVGKRMRRIVPTGFAPPQRVRTRMIAATIRQDGSVASGWIVAGELAGSRLDRVDTPALVALRERCLVQDPQGAAILEAYLDRRTPAWRVDAERDPDSGPRRAAKPGAMSHEEAYEVLGLERGATGEQIRSAHRALMKRLHPDQGGSAEGAARVNAARDLLLNRHR